MRKGFSIRLAAVGILAIMTLPAMAAGKVCNARTFGAKADGVTKDTKAIQDAIDACAAAGGGTVELSGGTFLSAPIEIKSNITLNIAKGSTLLGSSDHADYPRITEFRAPGTQALVSATNAEHVSITGAGTIDGAGASWWEMPARNTTQALLAKSTSGHGWSSSTIASMYGWKASPSRTRPVGRSCLTIPTM